MLLARRSAASFSSGVLSLSKMSSSSFGVWQIPVKFHQEDRIRHGDPRCSECSTSWWIERSSPQQAMKCVLFLMMMMDFPPSGYEETYVTLKVEQEDSCYLVMA